MIILSDMDGCVASFVSVVLAKYNAEHGTELTSEDITDNRMHLCIPRHRDIYKYFHEEGTFLDCPVEPGAQEVINGWLKAGHEFYFVTKPVDHSLFCLREKQAWVDKHFPKVGHKQVIFTGHKHLVQGDILIEDLPENLVRFPGLRVLIDQPWNRKYSKPDVVRHHSWEEIDATVRAMQGFTRSY